MSSDAASVCARVRMRVVTAARSSRKDHDGGDSPLRVHGMTHCASCRAAGVPSQSVNTQIRSFNCCLGSEKRRAPVVRKEKKERDVISSLIRSASLNGNARQAEAAAAAAGGGVPMGVRSPPG